jgi:uncharacterized membrane protein YraQ (UPF0718 family)
MKTNTPQTAKKGRMSDLIFLAAAASLALILLVMFPERRSAVGTAAWDFSKEMLAILPAVLVLMGLFGVWVSKELVGKYLGKRSGIKGIALALVFGALPTGPLYIAFPLAGALLKKGARLATVIVFLSAWACIKLPQEMVELQFLGWRFMAARLLLTIVFVTVMGVTIEAIVERWDRRADGMKEK